MHADPIWPLEKQVVCTNAPSHIWMPGAPMLMNSTISSIKAVGNRAPRTDGVASSRAVLKSFHSQDLSCTLKQKEDHQELVGLVSACLVQMAALLEVIIGSFVVDTNKEISNDLKFKTSSSKLPPQVIGKTFSSVIYHSPDSSGRNSGRVNNDHQNVGVNNFMLQSRGMHSLPSQSSDWRDSPGLPDHGAYQSSEDGDDGNLQH